jgi:hypothetical protein
MMSNVIQQEHNPAMPIEMEDRIVKASGGSYEDPEVSMLETVSEKMILAAKRGIRVSIALEIEL